MPYRLSMEIKIKDALARANDSSKKAAAHRLRGAIKAIGLTPTEFAKASGQNPNAVFNSISGASAGSFPSRKSMEALYRNHRIDANFILFGSYSQLPGDVQDRVFAALESITNDEGR